MAMMSDWDADGEYEARCHKHGHLSNHRSAADAAAAELQHQVEKHHARLSDGKPETRSTEEIAQAMTRKLTRAQRRNKFPKPGSGNK